MSFYNVTNLSIRAYSEHPEIYHFAEWLVDDYLSTKKRVRGRQQYILTARKLIASIWLREGDLFKFTTKADYFTPKFRKQVWMTSKVLKLFNHLKAIEPCHISLVKKGVSSKMSFNGEGLNTVYCRTTIFKDKLRNVELADILPNPELEPIELKDDNKKLLSIPQEEREQYWFIRSEEVINNHFSFLRNSKLTYPNGKRVSPVEYFYQRKFKNDFSSGGRWYSDFTRWSKQKRLNISFDKDKALSIDISQLHPTLIMRLYRQKDVEPIGMLRGDLKDAYHIPKYDHFPRVVHKKLVNTLFNSKNEDAALRSIMTAHLDINEDGEYVCNTYKGKQKRKGDKLFKDNKKGAKEYLEYFKWIHPYYSKAICSGIGIKLQKMDSHLVTNLIDVSTQVGIPVLPVHDEFVFPMSRLNDIQELLKRVFQITFKELGEIGSLGCKIAYPDGKETSITLNLQNSL